MNLNPFSPLTLAGPGAVKALISLSTGSDGAPLQNSDAGDWPSAVLADLSGASIFSVGRSLEITVDAPPEYISESGAGCNLAGLTFAHVEWVSASGARTEYTGILAGCDAYSAEVNQQITHYLADHRMLFNIGEVNSGWARIRQSAPASEHLGQFVGREVTIVISA